MDNARDSIYETFNPSRLLIKRRLWLYKAVILYRRLEDFLGDRFFSPGFSQNLARKR